MSVFKLDSSQRKVFSDFKCSNSDDASFVKEDIFTYQEEKLGVTYLLTDDAGKLLSFITLANGSIDLQQLKLELPISERPSKLPALLIGRIATSDGFQGKGHGSSLIEFAVSLALKLSGTLGIRMVIVHARTDTKIIDFYTKNGFTPCFKNWSGRDTIPMYLDLKSR